MKKNKAWLYPIARPFVTLWFCFCYHPKAYNKEVIPKKGRVIFCGNHRHAFDQFPVCLSTKRIIYWMAKKEYFEGKFGWFFRAVGCIRVNREIHDQKAKDEALEVLNHDLPLGLFPEGTRNKTNKDLLDFKFGAVSLAKKTKSPIIPFAITGNYKLFTKNLRVTFGEPFYVGNMTLEEANKKLRNTILKLYKENKD